MSKFYSFQNVKATLWSQGLGYVRQFHSRLIFIWEHNGNLKYGIWALKFGRCLHMYRHMTITMAFYLITSSVCVSLCHKITECTTHLKLSCELAVRLMICACDIISFFNHIVRFHSLLIYAIWRIILIWLF